VKGTFPTFNPEPPFGVALRLGVVGEVPDCLPEDNGEATEARVEVTTAEVAERETVAVPSSTVM